LITALRQRLYSCGEAFGYSSLAPGDWAGFPDTDLLVVAANQAEAERAPIN
jgi:predicted nucleotidyltransferase